MALQKLVDLPAASVTVSDTSPSVTKEGSLWFESDTTQFFVYYDNFWIEVGGAAVESIINTITAKGDLLVGTASAAVSKLAVGSNGRVLMADSAQTSGIKWGTAPFVTTSSAKSTDIPSPYEGQMIYETDTDMVALWNGSAWRYIAATTATNGSILQVVSATKTDTASLTSGTYADITGLSVSITPKSTSSKILVRMFLNVSTPSGERAFFTFVRDSTGIGWGDTAGNRTKAIIGTLDGVINNQLQSISAEYLDSPASSSALTYKVQYRVTGGTHYLNRAQTDSDQTYAARTSSTITIMEIAG